jgi:hypothetical protein
MWQCVMRRGVVRCAALRSPPLRSLGRYVLSVYVVMGIVFSFSMMVNTIVAEKEAKLLDGLQVMGLSESASFIGWWLFYVPLHSFSALVVTLIVALTGFLSGSNIFLLWCLPAAPASAPIPFAFGLALRRPPAAPHMMSTSDHLPRPRVGHACARRPPCAVQV